MHRSLRRLTVYGPDGGLLFTACSSAPGADRFTSGQSTGVVESQPAATARLRRPSLDRSEGDASPRPCIRRIRFRSSTPRIRATTAAQGLDATTQRESIAPDISDIGRGGYLRLCRGLNNSDWHRRRPPIRWSPMTTRSTGHDHYLCDRETINQRTDLKGKTLETTTGATPYVDLLPALLSKYGMSLDDIHVVSLDPKARVAALISGQIDLEAGFGYSTLGDIQQAAKAANAGEVCHLDLSDYGINALGHGIIVNQSTISNSPDVIEKFLRASNKGWQDALANPAAAVDATIADWPLTNHDSSRPGCRSCPTPCTRPTLRASRWAGWLSRIGRTL